MGNLLQSKEVAVALIGAGATVAVALLAHFFGFWKWAGGEISKWLEHRREIGVNSRAPKMTMYAIVGTGVIPPLMSGTDCRAPVLITNLSGLWIVPVRARVKLLGLERFRKRVYEISLTGPSARVDEAIPPRKTESWWLIFQVFPPMPPEKSLRVDVIVYDQFDNAHRAKNVRFTSGFPDAMPRPHPSLEVPK
jgi:hypothetical protein